ncbi:MAG: family transporter [Hydrocarboniphaga sp.]|uniref:AI-2E family transporter n=1 Tax=Hydrocarboniphaga sp. TaxID=2033016 RepID=UPI0026318D25|nr:AI-2E family transporter [Hydrocarboniphaga sp.]MDB5969642.1 family transporter [Hydrocarboniphaga sp.]
MNAAPESVEDSVASSFKENWPWMLIGLALLVFAWLLAPILTPFVVGAGLGYVGDPLVDRLERLRMSRTLGVGLMFLVIFSVLVLVILLVVPMLQGQLTLLIHNIPDWLTWIQDKALPKLGIRLPRGVQLDAEGLKTLLTRNWASASDILPAIWERASQSTGAIVTTVANLLLIPIVAFYLLRDWDRLVAWIRNTIPPRWRPNADKIAHETDSVLSAFFRGQLTVMAALTVYYWIALWLAGLNLALIVGLIIGLVSFVPYLGAVIGIVTAVLAMVVQTQELTPFIWLAVVFAIGQFLESNVFGPWLIGDRIGLHPVAVIFAVMAGGQLFGFIGVLLALPVAAVLAVMLRHTLHHWMASKLYLQNAPLDELTPEQQASSLSSGPLP